MPKLNLNSRIHKYSLIGRVEEHDIKLDQAVLVGSDVVFKSVTTTDFLTVGGNLTVNGTLTLLSTEALEVSDNIVEINKGETGAGVSSILSGLEVNRGTLTHQQIVFQETTDTWRTGEVGSTQSLANREDSPLINGIMTWNDSEQRIDSSNQINIDVIFGGNNPTSKSTGGIRMTGGIGIENDVYIGGVLYFEGTSPTHATISSNAANNLNIDATGNINLTPGGDINIPTNIGITFSADTQKIESNGTDLTIESGGDIDLTAIGDINIPTDVGITFSADTQKIESNGTDLTIESGGDINLTSVGDINIPTNVGITFSADTQKIESNGTDLTIESVGDINLTSAGDVNIPTNIGITFSADTQKIESNGTDLTIESGGDINLTSVGDINIPTNVGITFSADTQKIESNGSDLTISSGGVLGLNQVVLDVNATGSINLDGGGISQFTTSAGNLKVDCESGVLILDGNTGVDIDSIGNITLDTTDTSNGIDIGTGVSGVPITIGHTVSETTIGDNLTVNGDMTTTGTTSHDGTMTIDITDTEALLIRKNNDTGDVFTVNTTDSEVYINGINITPSPGDIAEISFSASNNISVAEDITGFEFQEGTVRSFKAIVGVSIIADVNIYEQIEVRGLQKGTGTWIITESKIGDDTNIDLTIISKLGKGQLQYTSSNLAGFVSNTIKFISKVTTI
jgi:uncharacterized protein (DUF2345 family)